MAKADDPQKTDGYAIAPGIVKNNIDCLAVGRVQVRVPSLPGFEPWCRISAVGGAGGRGLAWVPHINDEVLVAFSQNDERDAYIMGGLWSTKDRPPLDSPADSLTKKVIKTGATPDVGHSLEFDDAKQSVTITTSTKQTVTIDPKTIELKNSTGTLTIKMDNTTETITIDAGLKIGLKAKQITLDATRLELKGTDVSIKSSGPCTIKGAVVKIN
jgi:uncharacterized protein involved in type VI secretion and phage assembly